MTLVSDVTFGEKLALGWKNDMGNMVNFNWSSDKSENFHFDVLLLSIAYKVSAKKVLKDYISWQTLKSDWNWEEKLTFCLKNDMNNLVNFNSSSEKSENLHFDGIFLSKELCNVYAKKVDTSREKWLMVS